MNDNFSESPMVDSEPPLIGRVFKGGMWSFAGRFAGQGLGFIKIIILARILAPEDFGLFGIALLTLTMLEKFSQTGFDTALVQRLEDAHMFLDTTWTMQVFRGFFLAALLFFGAPLVARFFDEPRAMDIIRVLGLVEIINGFRNIGEIYFLKDLDFRKKNIMDLINAVGAVAVGITLAIILRSVWALVLGYLAGSVIGCILSYIMHPYRPRLRWKFEQAKELFRFGRWVFCGSILFFVLNNLDQAFVGWMLGPAMLGFYQMAHKISNMPTNDITSVISSVVFPAYSKIQVERERLSGAFISTFRLSAAFLMPITVGIVIYANDFTRVFLGEDWMPIVPVLRILAVWGLIKSLDACRGPLCLAVGKPWISSIFHIGRLIVLAASIYPLTKAFGISGTALSVTLASISSHLFFYPVIGRIIERGVLHIISSLVPSAVNTAVMTAGLYALGLVMAPDSFTTLIASVLAGAAMYFISCIIIEKIFLPDDKRTLTFVISSALRAIK